jgi:hypothetical protein
MFMTTALVVGSIGCPQHGAAMLVSELFLQPLLLDPRIGFQNGPKVVPPPLLANLHFTTYTQLGCLKVFRLCSENEIGGERYTAGIDSIEDHPGWFR